jgi:murein peptide amidase A
MHTPLPLEPHAHDERGLRPRPQRGTIPRAPECFGASRQGRPLEVWHPDGESNGLLVIAGIHGEEPETTVTLSSAMRSLRSGGLRAAVVLAANPDGLAWGTRGNHAGVDLNRNFPARDWSERPPEHHFTRSDPQDVLLSAGPEPASEPETRALIELVGALRPRALLCVHAPLGSVLDPEQSSLARWLSRRTELPLKRRVPSPTPGLLDTWAREATGAQAVTLELPVISKDRALRHFLPVLVELLTAASLP